MNATEILEMAVAAGIELTANDDKLAYHAPKGSLTPELRALLAEHKAEVLELLGELSTHRGPLAPDF